MRAYSLDVIFSDQAENLRVFLIRRLLGYQQGMHTQPIHLGERSIDRYTRLNSPGTFPPEVGERVERRIARLQIGIVFDRTSLDKIGWRPNPWERHPGWFHSRPCCAPSQSHESLPFLSTF